MSKVVAFVGLLAALLVAAACGGGSGSSSASIAGAIDSGVLSKSALDSGTYEVWAVQNGQLVRKGDISAKAAGEDHTFLVSGLTLGQEYTVTVYRAVGFQKIPVISTVTSASATSGTLERSKTLYKRQMNMVTTYVAQKVAAGQSKSEAVASVFGSSSTQSLDAVCSVGGILKTTTGTALAIQNPVAMAAVTQMTIATVVATSMSATTIASAATTITSFMTSMSAATSVSSVLTATASSSSGLSSIITSATSSGAVTMATLNTAIGNADLGAAAFVAAVSSSGLANFATAISTVTVTQFVTNIIVSATAVAGSAGVSSTLLADAAAASGVSVSTLPATVQTTMTLVQTSAVFTPAVTATATANGTTAAALTQTITQAAAADVTITIALADSAYGSGSQTSGFTLTTLAPVFKLSFSRAIDLSKSGSDFTATVTKKSTGTKVSLSTSTAELKLAYKTGDVSTSVTEVYLIVKGTNDTGDTSKGLEEGTEYTVTINKASAPQNTYVTLPASVTVTTASVTYSVQTYIAGTWYTQLNHGLAGVSTYTKANPPQVFVYATSALVASDYTAKVKYGTGSTATTGLSVDNGTDFSVATDSDGFILTATDVAVNKLKALSTSINDFTLEVYKNSTLTYTQKVYLAN